MSFLAAEAASCTWYWGTILIYNFAMEANRRGRYHCRQLAGKQINFFPSISPLHSARWAAFPEMMCRFIGVDASCQSNIRGTGNWQWRWWGNPHAYISADKGGSRDAPPPFLPAVLLAPFFCRYNASPWLAFPLKSPLLFSHEKLFMFLVFHSPATPASNQSVLAQSRSLSLSYLQLWCWAGRGGVRRGCRLTPLQLDREGAPVEQLRN